MIHVVTGRYVTLSSLVVISVFAFAEDVVNPPSFKIIFVSPLEKSQN